MSNNITYDCYVNYIDMGFNTLSLTYSFSNALYYNTMA